MKTEMTTTLHNLVIKDLRPSAKVMSPQQIGKWQDELPEIADRLFGMMSILYSAQFLTNSSTGTSGNCSRKASA